jgi:flagellar FliL protein
MATPDGTSTTPVPQRAERTTTNRKDPSMATKTDADPRADAAEAAPAKGGKKKILMAAPVVVLLAGLAFFFLKPKEAAAVEEKPKPVAGPVVELEPITVNLSGAHYLKLGLALQPTAAAGEEVAGAKALDLAIGLFSGRTIAELSGKEGREKAKAQLVKEVAEAYEDEVYDVYFTTFVMQ